MKASTLVAIIPAVNALLAVCGVGPIMPAYDVASFLERLEPAIAEAGEKRRARRESQRFASPGLCVTVDGRTYETAPVPRRGGTSRQAVLSARSSGRHRTMHDAFRRQFELGGFSLAEAARMADRALR
jgi:hypothetical protein